MRISTQVHVRPGREGGFREVAAHIRELERAGLDIAWVPESYGFDAPTAMGYLAAVTERIEIGSGIINIYTRTPTLIAETAAGLDFVSGGRAILGLGTSGPQVMEGFHGVPFDAPLDTVFTTTLDALGDILASDGLVVVEHARRRSSPDAAGRLRRVRQVTSGDSALAFYELKT